MAVGFRPSYSYSDYGGSSASMPRRHSYGVSAPDPSYLVSYDYGSSSAEVAHSYCPRASGSSHYHDTGTSYCAETASHRSPSTYHAPSTLRRAVTSPTTTVYESPHLTSPRERSSGLVGSLGMSGMSGMLGAAAAGAVAGAALTYTVMSSSSSSSSRTASRDLYSEEPIAMSGLTRRSNFLDPYPLYAATAVSTRYSGQEGMRMSSHKPRRGRENVSDYDDGRPSVRTRTRHSSSSRRHRSNSRPAGRSCSEAPLSREAWMLTDPDLRYESGSYAPLPHDSALETRLEYRNEPSHSSRREPHHDPRHDTRYESEARYEASYTSRRDTLRGPEARYESNHPSRRESRHQPETRYEPSHGSRDTPRHDSWHEGSRVPTSLRRGATFDVTGNSGGAMGLVSERESYVSTHNHRTQSTVRNIGGSVRQPQMPPNSSRSATLLRAPSRTNSYRSSRNAPLPSSVEGSSHARWDVEDSDGEDSDPIATDNDIDCVMPDDSISCVGSRDRY